MPTDYRQTLLVLCVVVLFLLFTRRPASRKSEYHRYLQTSQWKDRALRCKARAGYSCEICGYGPSPYMQAHHVTYERIGHERDSDLLCVCAHCHKLIHGR